MPGSVRQKGFAGLWGPTAHEAHPESGAPRVRVLRFGQCLRLLVTISMPVLGASLSRLSARFSFSDFADFLDMLERGDLSAIEEAP